jgi:hypothetical protein
MTQVKEVPMLLDGRDATVAVIGSDLISREVLLVVGEIVDHQSWEKDPGIRSIVFRDDGFPVRQSDPAELLLGVADPDAKAIVINLQRCFEEAVRVTKETVEASVYSAYLFNVWATVAHEAYHLHLRATPDERTELLGQSEAERKLEDSNADRFALELIYGIAEEVRIEPGEWVNEPYFAKAIDAEFASTAAEDEHWVKAQKHLLDDRLFFLGSDTENPLPIHTMKHYVMYHNEPKSKTPDADFLAKWDRTDEPICDRIIDLTLRAEEINPKPVNTNTNTEPIDVAFAVVNSDEPEFDDDTFEDAEYSGFPEVTPATGSTGIPEASGFGGTGAATAMASQPAPQYQPTPPVAPQVQPEATLPVTSMSNQQLTQVISGLYVKLHNHIFAYCGFRQGGEFMAGDKIMEIPVQLTPQEREVVIGYNCKDMQGRWCPGCSTSDGLLRGYTRSRQPKLPMFEVFLNFNGVQVQRRIMPQNPTTNSRTAEAARNGSRITWIMEADNTKINGPKDLYKGRVVDNGGYQAAQR